MSDKQFTLDQAMAAQRRLREELGLPEETFPLPAFVGMLSDEIERLRAAGRSDDDTARLVSDATGVPVGADDLRRFYAPPDKRRRD